MTSTSWNAVSPQSQFTLPSLATLDEAHLPTPFGPFGGLPGSDLAQRREQGVVDRVRHRGPARPGGGPSMGGR